jgi:peptidyl-prolyl cis-trans isomerase D
MSLINKIRERSGLAVGVIAVSLLLFIVGSDLIGGKGMLFGGNSQEMGKIDGKAIDAQEFNARVDVLREQFAQQAGRQPTEEDMPQLREQAWNQLIFEISYQKEFDKLGLTVTPDELVDMVQGTNISPAVRQAFTDPKTGVFDKNQVIGYLKGLRNLPPQQQQAWASFEKNLASDRLREKYENLMRLSVYTTTAEAKKEYEAQNTKADLKYLFVPYYTVNDTTVNVSDGQLQTYLNAHKAEYPGQDSRSFQYVTFSIAPSKDDSAALYTQIKQLARQLGTAPNDSSFARLSSDLPLPLYQTVGEMPVQLQSALPTFTPGGIYGPFRVDNTYYIYKFSGTKRDTSFTARASHILIRPTAQTDSAKAEARRKAEGLLKQIQGGASFEALAQTNSADGSAAKGGDLGYFKNTGQMVKPFESAVFGATSTGLIPRLVETDFGFHIINVTSAKTNLLYRLAGIGKTLSASTATNDEALRRAEQFAATGKDKDAFFETAKKDKTLVLASADKVAENATSVNSLTEARQLVRWAFDDKTALNSVSAPFQIGEQWVVAVLTNKTDKSSVKTDDYREELTARVRNQLKAEQIIAKLGTGTGPLDAIAQKYGAGALIETAPDVSLATGFLRSAGVDPVGLGKGFGLKVGQRSKPFAGETGVLILESLRLMPAPPIADYGLYKNLLQQNKVQLTGRLINEAIKAASNIEDRRAKFF